ncbi:MAG: PAS domain S-box protein [Nevskia sp.]|nr:PAS domain S-box protein [Nevskia sp.]
MLQQTIAPPQEPSASPATADARTVAALKAYAGLAGALAALVGGLVLGGWFLGVEVLKSVVPGWPTMKANTALSFILAGASLLSLRTPPEGRGAPARHLGGYAAALLVFLIGSLSLLEYLLARKFGIDELLVRDYGTLATASPGRMSPMTALSFVLLGAALLCPQLELRGGRRPSQYLALGSGLIGMCGFLGYLYGALEIRVNPAYTSMAVHTAVVVTVLSLGVLAACPDRGMMAVLSAGSPGGLLARRMIPTVLVFSVTLGWLRAQGQRLGYYDTGFGVVIMVGALCIFVAVMSMIAARAVDRVDAGRRSADSGMRKWAQLFEQSPHAMMMVDRAGRIVLVNRLTEQLFGYGRQELLGAAVEMLLPPAARGSHPGLRQGYSAQPVSRSMGVGRDLRGLTSDGREVPVEIGLSGIETDEGSFVLASVVDITERKRAEEALRASEARFRLTVSSVKDYAIFLLGPQGHVASWNEGARRLKGYTEGEVVGRHFAMFYPPEDRRGGRPERILGLAAKQGRCEDEGWRLRKDGSRFRANVVITAIRDEHGTLTGFSKATRDLTEHQRLESRFRYAVESAPNAMIMVSREGKMILINRQAEKLFGYGREELLDESLEMLVPLAVRTGHAAMRAGYDASPATRPMGMVRNIRGVTKEGREVPLDIGLSPVETEEGTFTLASIIDITERMQAEQALRAALEKQAAAEATRRWSDLLQRVAWGVAVRTADGRTLDLVNPAFARMHGYTVEELVGVPGLELAAVESRPQVAAAIEEALRGGHSTLEMLRRRKDDSTFPALVDLTALRNDAGEVESMIVSVQDITLLKEAEQATQRANQELEAFSYSVAHDLRAPLRSINGFTEILRKQHAGRIEDEGKVCLDRVVAASRRMGELIDALLALSRVSRAELRWEQVNLSELARAIADKLRDEAPQRAVEFIIEDGVTSEGDSRLLGIVLENLFGNAWKYSGRQPHTRIEFGETRENGRPLYYVRDNGAGFDMAYASKLFGAFQRLHSAREFEGTGIGLATVQRIVHRHGGEVRAEGKVNEGATFYFTL